MEITPFMLQVWLDEVSFCSERAAEFEGENKTLHVKTLPPHAKTIWEALCPTNASEYITVH